MILRSRSLLLCAALHAASAAASVAQVDTLGLRRDTRFLSADSLQGRDTGSAGERLAAAYIAERLRALGLEPVDRAGFIVPLPLVRAQLAEASRVRVSAPTGAATFASSEFHASIGGVGSLRSFEGPAVFIRSTLDAAATADVYGRVIVTTGPLGEAGAPTLRRWIAEGAAGVILPTLQTAEFQQVQAAATRDLLVDAGVDEPVWQPDLPIIIAAPNVVRALISTRPPGPADGIDSPHELAVTVAAELRFATTVVPSFNVAGIVPGSDPALRDEYVILTAHYDHLGTGPPIEGDSIYNGFSDNAAGVAMLLAIAERLRERPPARSVVLLFPSGEERGLLGSAHWAAHPPVALERVHAVLNLDAGAPPAPPTRWRVAGDTTTAAIRTAGRVIGEHGWTVDTTPANANSDHWPFMQRGIPTVFLVPGTEWEGLDEAGRQQLRSRWDHYHSPLDEWHPEFPFAGLARYADLACAITRALADPHLR